MRWLTLPAILTAVLCFPAASIAQPEDPDVARERLERLERELEERSQRQENLAREAEETGRKVEALTRRILATTAQVQSVEERVATVARKIATLSELLAEEEAALQKRRVQMARLLAALQRLSRRPSELVLLRPGEAADSVKTAILLRETVPALERQAAAIGRKVAEIRELRKELQAERDDLAAQRAELDDKRAELRALRRERETERERLLSEAEAEAARVERLAEEAENLECLLAGLERERERRMAAARDAAERLGRAPPRPESETRESAPFSEARGNLPLPARGQLAVGFGEASDPLRQKGITIATLDGAQVVAPYDGRIAFSGRFGAYGRLLIIAHSEGYHTLLAGMERIFASVGQWVLAGEPVGVMGDDGSDSRDNSASSNEDGPRLYLELRRDGTPVDPMPWLAAGLGRVG